MSETPRHDGLDLSYVQDPDARRALRMIHQQISEAVTRQQMEIDAMLELMIEKHVTSLSEFRRNLIRLQQDTTRMNRIHGAMAPAAHGPGGTAHPGH
ncbi:MAG: hypothetical protein NTU53_07080 [Planctomycetota bacterium]|nr:hypothetical protein [Planctomycetota bacterium]